MTNIVALLLDGLTFGGLLFLIASGLTLTFGLMRTLNLAHAGFYLLGGYLAIETMNRTGNYWLAILVAILVVGLLGMVVERIFIHRFIGLDFFKNELPQIIVTIGLAYIISDQVLAWFGPAPRIPPLPPMLGDVVKVGDLTYSVFRLALLAAAVLLWLGLYLIIARTKVGAMIRAAVDDPAVASASGVRVNRLFMLVFAAGAALAAFAGVWGGAFIGLAPGTELELLLLALIVVVVGGLGSVGGAFIAAMAVGVVNELGKTMFPELTLFALFAPVAIILLLRPSGIRGER